MLKLILIAGIWINPVAVTSLEYRPWSNCWVNSGADTVAVDLPCNEVAAIINKEIE